MYPQFFYSELLFASLTLNQLEIITQTLWTECGKRDVNNCPAHKEPSKLNCQESMDEQVSLTGSYHYSCGKIEDFWVENLASK